MGNHRCMGNQWETIDTMVYTGYNVCLIEKKQGLECIFHQFEHQDLINCLYHLSMVYNGLYCFLNVIFTIADIIVCYRET